MIYECDQCHAPLPSSVNVCPKCGERFDNEVPADAEIPTQGFTAKPNGTGDNRPNVAPLISNTPPSYVSRATPPASGFSFLRVLIALPIVLAVMVGAVVLTSPSKSSGGSDTSTSGSDGPSPIANVVNPQHSVTYKVTGSARSVDVTYQNGTGGTEQKSHVAVPWSQIFQSSSGAYLYLSAQNQGNSGDLTTEIDVDGSSRKQANASGAYVIANVNDSL